MPIVENGEYQPPRNRFEMSIKDVDTDMMSATDVNIHWFAYLYLRDSLKNYEKALEEATEYYDIGYYRYQVIEAKKLLCELYDKLLQYPNFQGGLLERDDWMEEFLHPEKTENEENLA